MVDRVNFVSEDKFSGDRWGHGTHVAGIICGSGASFKEKYYVGIAPGADLVDLRVLEQAGTGLVSEVVPEDVLSFLASPSAETERDFRCGYEGVCE